MKNEIVITSLGVKCRRRVHQTYLRRTVLFGLAVIEESSTWIINLIAKEEMSEPLGAYPLARAVPLEY